MSQTVNSERAKILRDRIQRDYIWSFLFVLFIATLTGLQNFYIGQPFGTLKDYIGLFLWAAGTKAAMDILGMVLDRLPVISTKV